MPIHAEGPLAGDRSQAAYGIDIHWMNRLAVSLAFPVGPVSTDRQVLDESTSGGHVQHLGATSYPQDR